ncbi:MAG: hypothetical protein WA081_08350 [Desulfosalsimonadaceae bacterium]
MIKTEKDAMHGNRSHSHPAKPFRPAMISGWCHPLFHHVLMTLGILLAAALGPPPYALALQPLSETESRNVTATSGMSFAADDAIVYFGGEAVRFISVGNKNIFSATTASEGYLSLNDTAGLATLDNTLFQLDIGRYHAPVETYYVADRVKKDDDYHGWLRPGHVWLTSGTIDSTPKFWTVRSDRPRPLNNTYAVIQATINDLLTDFDMTTTLGFFGGEGSARTLSDLSVSGIHMPALTVGGVAMPGAKLTLYPDNGSSINFELRTRLTIDEIQLSNPANTGSPDLLISGVHLGEAFYNPNNINPLPSHWNATGTTTIDTSAWGSSFTSFMYGGYFLIGNLNQVDFTDYLQKEVTEQGTLTFDSGRQLYVKTGQTTTPLQFKDDTLDVPLSLTANPVTFNIGTRSDTHNIWDTYISLTAGLFGSLRIESLAGMGREFGPVAVDGLRVNFLEIEFPGGYQREFFRPPAQGGASLGWYEKGRIYPGQLAWLQANDAAVPDFATGVLPWLLTP